MHARLSLLLVLGLFAQGAAAATSPILLTSAARISATAGGGSFQPVLSPDGRFVAFVSFANNLAFNDDRLPYLDVFLRDR